MTRHFFSEGVQERFAQSRFDAIHKLGRIAEEESCRFMVVCGDVFESNLVDRKTVSRALEALKDVPFPVYLLPGNHDPLNAASVYRSSTFRERKPPHVHVIEDITPIKVSEGMEIVGVPWTSRRPLHDLVAAATAQLESSPDTVRICVAHGMVDSISPDPDDPAVISLQAAEEAIAQGKIHYLALGDRHSLTQVGDTGRIWYAGSPEQTDYNEVKSGFALVVDLDREKIAAREINIGEWRFIERKRLDMNTREDMENLRCWLEEIDDKECAVVKLRLVGTLSLLLYDQLQKLFMSISELLGALEIRTDKLVVIPEDADFADFGFSGFVHRTVEQLRSNAQDAGPAAINARDALTLLVRLAGKAP